MTLKEIQERIRAIEALAVLDPELAHKAQDELYLAILAAIRRGCKDPKRYAAEALRLSQMKFPRWYG